MHTFIHIFYLRLPKDLILSRISAYGFLLTSTSNVPLPSFLIDTGVKRPERVFSITKGLSFDIGLSSNDSRTIKCGNDDC